MATSHQHLQQQVLLVLAGLRFTGGYTTKQIASKCGQEIAGGALTVFRRRVLDRMAEDGLIEHLDELRPIVWTITKKGESACISPDF